MRSSSDRSNPDPRAKHPERGASRQRPEVTQWTGGWDILHNAKAARDAGDPFWDQSATCPFPQDFQSQEHSQDRHDRCPPRPHRLACVVLALVMLTFRFLWWLALPALILGVLVSVAEGPHAAADLWGERLDGVVVATQESVRVETARASGTRTSRQVVRHRYGLMCATAHRMPLDWGRAHPWIRRFAPRSASRRRKPTAYASRRRAMAFYGRSRYGLTRQRTTPRDRVVR